jgi:hypothetical protein
MYAITVPTFEEEPVVPVIVASPILHYVRGLPGDFQSLFMACWGEGMVVRGCNETYRHRGRQS